jgi:hypothetical protein
MRTAATLAAVSVLLTVGTNAWAGRGVGNPSGGMIVNGVATTFGDAGIVIEPQPLTEIPGLQLLWDTIEDMGLNAGTKTGLRSVVLPYGGRQYFNVDASSLDEEQLRHLKEEYAKVTKQPVDKIVIYALTNPENLQTYLLPAFYELGKQENGDEKQATILYHEGYWLKKPDATYLEMVQAEQAFANYLKARREGGYDPQFAKSLARLTGAEEVPVNMALKVDLDSGVLKDLDANADGVLMDRFFSPEGLFCSREGEAYPSVVFSSSSALKDKLFELAHTHPKSQFIRSLLDFFSSDENRISGTIRMTFRTNIDPHEFRNCTDALKAIKKRVRLFTNNLGVARELRIELWNTGFKQEW